MKKLLSTVLIILALFTIPAYAGDFQNSIRAFVGGHEFKPPNFTSEEYDYFWYSISYNPTTKINSWLSYSNSIGMGLLGAREASAPTIEYRLLPRLTWKMIYFQAGGGLAYVCNGGDIPNLGPSPLLGILSAEIGVNLTEDLSLGYAWEHLSDPFFDDAGWNVGALVFTVRF